MNFNEYYNKQPVVNPDKHNIHELLRSHAARAFHFAQRQERERCIAAVESVQGTNEPAPDHAYEYMIESREQFDSGVNAIVELTIGSAVDAIKHNKG